MHYKKPWLPLGALHPRTRGYLPHWQMSDAVYSITYGLHDALPRNVRVELIEERRALAHSRFAEMRHEWEVSLDHALNRHLGAAYLMDDRVASIVAQNFAHFDGVRYSLLAWCVMPTHVHVVFKAYDDLSKIVHSWKSFTAKEANRILGRQGAFWAREYFDRIVRNEEDLSRTIAYVVNNPVKAGLKDWKWVWVR